MKAWMRVSVTESDRYGRSLEMFLRWKKADLVMDLMCDWKERVESRITPGLRTSGDGQMDTPSTRRTRSPTFLSSAGVATPRALFSCC